MFWTRKNARCHKVQGKLSEYVDNLLSPRDRELEESHLKSCPKCSTELESLRMTVQLLRQTHEVAVPRSFALRAIDVEKKGVVAKRPGWFRPAAAMATVTAMALAFLVVGDSLHMFERKVAEPVAVVMSTPAETPAPAQPAENATPGPKAFQSPLPTAGAGAPAAPAPSATPPIGGPGIAVILETTPEATPEQEKVLSPPAAAPTGLPPAAPVAPEPTPTESERAAAAPVQENIAQGAVTWPLRQIEIALAAVLVILASLAIVSFRRRRNRGY